MAKKGGASISKVSRLHELLVDLFIQDIEFCISEGIPMSASDKGVIVSFLKNEEITATPDDDKLESLKDTFKELTEDKRKAMAAAITAQASDLSDMLPMS